MNDFSFNYSPVNESHCLSVNSQTVTALRVQARMILVPFFQKIALTEADNQNSKSYPVLTDLAGKILTDVFEEGGLGYESLEEACQIALGFIKSLNVWQVHCLAFYFCTNEQFIENYEEQHPDDFYEETPKEDWNKVTGKYIAYSIQRLCENPEELSQFLAQELIHLQDIFSTEDINSWDASSIMYANENFESYAGASIKLIALPLDDFEYWEKIIEPSEDENDEDEDEDLDENDDLGWVAREWIDYIKEYNKPLYLELMHNSTLEQAAREKQQKYFRKLDELQASQGYTEKAAEEEARRYLYPRRSI